MLVGEPVLRAAAGAAAAGRRLAACGGEAGPAGACGCAWQQVRWQCIT